MTEKEKRKAEKRQEKSRKQLKNNNKKRTVVCLKYGNKYGPEYVNKLYSMVSRNLTLEHEFVCFTENTKGIDRSIKTQPLPTDLGLTGWWFKPLFFNPSLVPNSTILYLDLDLIIFRNIDGLFKHQPNKFCIIRDFNRYLIKNYNKFNSSVFRLESGQHSHVYTDFIKNSNSVVKRFAGDQDWIRHCISKDYEYWPDEWVQSYKWEMRSKPRMTRDTNGRRNWHEPGTPKVNPETSIAVFHGDPKPDTCVDPWCSANWH